MSYFFAVFCLAALTCFHGNVSYAVSPQGELVAVDLSKVQFLEGRVHLRGKSDETSLRLEEGAVISLRHRVFCREDAKLVLTSGNRNIRFLEGASFSCNSRTVALWGGALLIDQRDNNFLEAEPFRIGGPQVEVLLLGRGTLMVEVVTSGGLKLIGLTGLLKLRLPDEDKVTELRPGELRFAKPSGKGFGDLVNLNLETLVSTAALINEFPNERPFKSELSKALIEQQALLTKRYRARVGDSLTPETFRLLPLRGKNQ